jgi:glycerol-3-phosphate dehydrogenase (NAD(P)+)
MTDSKNIAVIGGGSWATAIIKMLTDNLIDKKICWWMRCAESVEHVRKYKRNLRYLGSVEIKLPEEQVSNDLKSMISQSDWILLCVPAAFLKDALSGITPEDLKGKKIISAIKGIVPEHNLIIGEFMNQHYST